MGTFLTENFLLETDAAVRLYHEYAAELPILDYHCHLPPMQVAVDWQFENLTEIWLAGDHYKWRAMRAAGVPEEKITGNASPREKFDAWAHTVPLTLRNPLYHWTHLELRRPLGIDDSLLSPETADSIWERANEQLATPEFSARGIMRQMRVALVCTTDDPVDDLAAHTKGQTDRKQILDQSLKTGRNQRDLPSQMLPTFRPDRARATESPTAWNAWCDQLETATKMNIWNLSDFVEALRKRHQYFHDHGCRLSDHGLPVPHGSRFTEAEVAATFKTLRSGAEITRDARDQFSSFLMNFFGEMDADAGWTMQLHIGPQRNNCTRLWKLIGPDAGADSMGDKPIASALAKFLDQLDRVGKLPKTILYNLNPAMNDVLATMVGNFQDGSIPGKIQFGSGWWFLDQKSGIEHQLETLSNQGLLSLFVGMLTDSRSFLSYTRHEYFRRILCNLLGNDMTRGYVPNDFDMIGQMVQNICWFNAVRYFGFDL